MADIEWKRVFIVSAGVILSQAFLGNLVGGLAPTVTGFGIGAISIGGLVTAGIGVLVGEFVATKL